MKDLFPQLAGLRQTEIVSADGQKMILFHHGKLDDEDIKEIETFTADEIKAILTVGRKFKEYKLGEA